MPTVGSLAALAQSARRLFGALVAAIWLASAASGEAQGFDPNQRAFEAGLQAASRGQWPIAIVILTDLAERTDQPRVRLELARVLYLAGEFRRSKAEFLKVYRRDIPYPVRRSINVYLDEIDQRIGFLQPQLSLVVDNNPGRTAGSGTYEILGAPFEYQQPQQKEVGLAYHLSGARPLTAGRGRRQWVLAGAADGQSFGDRGLDFGAYSLAVRVDDHARNDRLSLGWRYHDQPASDAQGPYIEYFRRLAGQRGRQTVVQASLEADRYADLPDLDGVTATLAIDQARDLGPRASGHLTLGVSGSDVRDSRLPKAGAFTVVGVSRSLPRLNTSLVANLTLSQAWYGQRDPFFGEVRRDGFLRADLAFYSARPVFGLFPGIVASAEARTSTIDFYGYHRAGLSVDFRRRF
jgi:hypothetical protein